MRTLTKHYGMKPSKNDFIIQIFRTELCFEVTFTTIFYEIKKIMPIKYLKHGEN